MAETTFTIDETSVGETLPVTDGYITGLVMTQGPTVFENPAWDEGRQIWVAAYFVLRGTKDLRDLICLQPSTTPAFSWFGSSANMIVNGNLPFLGDLTVIGLVADPLGCTQPEDRPRRHRQ